MKFIFLLTVLVNATSFLSALKAPFGRQNPVGDVVKSASKEINYEAAETFPKWAITPTQKQVYWEMKASKVAELETSKNRFSLNRKKDRQKKLDKYLASKEFSEKVRQDARTRDIAKTNEKARMVIDNSEFITAQDLSLKAEKERKSLQRSLLGPPLSPLEAEKLMPAFKKEFKLQYEVDKSNLEIMVHKLNTESLKRAVTEEEKMKYESVLSLLPRLKENVNAAKSERLTLQERIYGRKLTEANQGKLDEAFKKELMAVGKLETARDKFYPGSTAARAAEKELVAKEALLTAPQTQL